MGTKLCSNEVEAMFLWGLNLCSLNGNAIAKDLSPSRGMNKTYAAKGHSLISEFNDEFNVPSSFVL